MEPLMQFDIQQDRWKDCWVAATTAARSRRRNVDFSIAQRVRQLLEEHGPASQVPLTLRVYGTMIKGFCVLNNEQVRRLYGDCERVALAFSKPGAEDEASCRTQSGGSKRKMVDAVTLNLDISKVRDAEEFGWTQASLDEGEGARLQLLPLQGDWQATPTPGTGGALPFQSALLDEVFPALDVPMTEAVDMSQLPLLDVDDGERPAGAGETKGPAPAAVERRGKKRQAPTVDPGKVFGFDQETTLPGDTLEMWERNARELARRLSFEELVDRAPQQIPIRLGILAELIDWDPMFDAVPDVWATEEVDPFRPYVPMPPLGGSEGVTLAIEAALGETQVVEPGQAEKEHRRKNGKLPVYDAQTASVGAVLRQLLESASGCQRPVTFDDLVPEHAADRGTAARTLHAVLTLATAGELQVEQLAPYAPIAISARG